VPSQVNEFAEERAEEPGTFNSRHQAYQAQSGREDRRHGLVRQFTDNPIPTSNARRSKRQRPPGPRTVRKTILVVLEVSGLIFASKRFPAKFGR
jgi:hypothetical protein